MDEFHAAVDDLLELQRLQAMLMVRQLSLIEDSLRRLTRLAAVRRPHHWRQDFQPRNRAWRRAKGLLTADPLENSSERDPPSAGVWHAAGAFRIL
eukprot:2537653-Rhodomonas_salina.1